MNDDLYQEAIVMLAKKARALSRLDAPNRTATADNPLCGDRVTLDFTVEDGLITAFGHKTRGCLLCEASSFLIADHVVGEHVSRLLAAAEDVAPGIADDAVSMEGLWPGLGTLTPVRRFKSRHVCVSLPFTALIRALEHKED